MPRVRRAVAALGALTLVTSLTVVATQVPAVALDNGLARTPPMGWNGFNHFSRSVTASIVEAEAQTIVSSGMKAAGYTYVNLDGGWDLLQRNADGELQPDPAKFPDGIKALADYVHSLGLKFGIYTSVGTTNCAGTSAGSWQHYQQDVDTFASWGVDYVKVDWCAVPQNQFPGMTSEQIAQQLYGEFGQALHAAGRPMVYSMSTNTANLQAWTWGADVGNLWRTHGDLGDNWGSLESVIAQNAALAQYAHPGAWNDPDMLQVGNGGLTNTEEKTHFGLWAEMAAPLLAGNDLSTMSAATRDMLTNTDVIAVDQDPLGVQGKVIEQNNGTMVFNKPLVNGDRAVALYNSNDSASTISTPTSALGLANSPAYTAKDLWSGTTSEVADTITASLPAHGTALLRVHADRNWADYPPAASIGITSPTGFASSDVAVQAGGSAPLTSTLTNSGQVPLENVQVSGTLPSGWTLTPTTPTGKGALTTDRSFATGWTVSVPDGTAPGSYPLTITARYAWDQGTKPGSVQTNAVVLVAIPPPSGSTPLSDVPWVSATNGWGPVEKDMSNGETAAGDGHPITIRGQVYPKGFGTNATSDIVFYLGGNCTSLTTDVGIDDEEHGLGQVIFQIFAGDTKVADSGVVTGTSPVVSLNADVTGATWLRLHDDPDGPASNDHGDWAGPVLTCS